MSRKAIVRWLIGLAVSAVFLWLAFRAVNPAEVWQEILGADQSYLLPAIACTTLTQFLRGWRWQLCFERADRVSFWQANAAYSVGSLSGQTVVPARLGDLVRVVALSLLHERVGLRDLVRYVAERNLGALGRYLWERVRTPEAARALGTLVIERLFDLFAVVLLLTVVLPLFPGLSSWIKIFDGIAAVVAFAVLAVVYVISRRTEQLAEPRWVTGRRPLEIGFRLLLQVMKGFSAVRDPRRALVLLVLSAALWLSQTGTYAIAFSAVHIPLGWKEGALTTAVLALTAIIPTGPGFAGSFELATQQLLALFAVDRTLATGYQEYTRLINLIASVIYLVVCLAALKLWPSREPRPSAQTAPAFD
ncbi:MAG TPA: lysylphosphatidylglycerol synthase transmembrane domain-containing protein [Chloroflexota bacterium]|nr:lysylphosphatidylglycerol synthase transmembrane domain-containing protein [Chloroflexota bacterium]